MLDSYLITKYFGFTEDEVKTLCEEYGMDFETIRTWYNGYLIDGLHMYNPNSVDLAMESMKGESCLSLFYDFFREKFIPEYTRTGFPRTIRLCSDHAALI